MSVIGRLEHVGIGASRDTYEQTISFYEKIFGWHRIKDDRVHLAFIGEGDGGRLEILANDNPPLVYPHHLAFVISEGAFDATVQALREAGATGQEPIINPFGDRLVFFSD